MGSAATINKEQVSAEVQPTGDCVKASPRGAQKWIKDSLGSHDSPEFLGHEEELFREEEGRHY